MSDSPPSIRRTEHFVGSNCNVTSYLTRPGSTYDRRGYRIDGKRGVNEPLSQYTGPAETALSSRSSVYTGADRETLVGETGDTLTEYVLCVDRRATLIILELVHMNVRFDTEILCEVIQFIANGEERAYRFGVDFGDLADYIYRYGC